MKKTKVIPSAWKKWIEINRWCRYVLLAIALFTGAGLSGAQKATFIILSIVLSVFVLLLIIRMMGQRKNVKKRDIIVNNLTPYISSEMPRKPYAGKTFYIVSHKQQDNVGTMIAGYLKSVQMKQVNTVNEDTDWVIIDFDDLPSLSAYRYQKDADGSKQLVYDHTYDYTYATAGKPITERLPELKQTYIGLQIYSARSLAEHFKLLSLGDGSLS